MSIIEKIRKIVNADECRGPILENIWLDEDEYNALIDECHEYLKEQDPRFDPKKARVFRVEGVNIHRKPKKQKMDKYVL